MTNLSGTTEKGNESSDSPCSFQYDALRPNEIRLLRYAGTPSDFQLTHVSFQNAPDYIALSYFWGDPKLCHIITCNGQPMAITENLHKTLAAVYAAIRRGSTAPLYEKDEDILLWADGICINQTDVEEKNQQVSMMAEIYRNAKGSIGYIGSPPPGVNATASFEAFARFAGAKIATSETAPGERGSKEDPVTTSRGIWNSPWFFRSWVTQEAVLSKDMICIFGDELSTATFSIDTLGALVHQVQIPGKADLKSGFAEEPNREHPAVQVHSWCQLRTSLRREPSGINLIKVLDLLQPADAMDKRDKVYSILGILKQHDRQSIKVNYAEENTVQQTYTDLAKYCISTPDCMRMLEHAGTKRQITNMPTWVPDWSCRPRFPLDSRLYRAAGDTNPSASMSACGRKVITKAFPFDKIVIEGLQVSYPEFRVRESAFKDPLTHGVLILLEELCQQFCQMVQTSSNRNPGQNPDEPLDQIVSRILTADRGYGDRRANPDDVKFYRAFMECYPRGSEKASQPVGHGTDNSYLPFQVMAIHCQRGRRICLTQTGSLGLMPDDAKAGDFIAILPGGNLPFVLRKKEKTEFEVVGHAYVHGAMDGEVLARFHTRGLTTEEIFSKSIALV
jgi:Heterokaryon incompatibility protein (HET)